MKGTTATAPSALWVVDFTDLATFSGFVYVAFAFDVFSRMIVGWRAARTMRTDLPLDALNMALWHRGRGTVSARASPWSARGPASGYVREDGTRQRPVWQSARDGDGNAG